MFFSAGFIIAFGFLFLAFKLKASTTLRMLGYPLAIDIVAVVVAYILHWGTFSGVMAAAFAGMLISLLTSGGRWLIGYIHPDTRTYVRGIFDLSRHLQ